MSEVILFSRLLEGLIYNNAVYKNVEERSISKKYCPLSLNNRLVNHLIRLVAFCSILSMVSVLLDQLQIFWQLYLIELFGLLAGLGLLVALNISKVFERVWHAGLIHKLMSYEISGQVFDHVSSFLSNRWLWVVLDGKSLQKYPVNAGVP